MNLWQDLRYAVRMLVKDRWFALAAATALALGIGADASRCSPWSTRCSSAVCRSTIPNRSWCCRPAPSEARPGSGFEDFKDWRDRSRSFSHLTARLGTTVNVSDNDHVPERYQGDYISWNFFRMIGQRPILGRDFEASDDVPGAQPVVILGYGAWRSRYGGDPNVLGKTIRVNSRPANIVGVMPQGMQFPNNDDLLDSVGRAAAWLLYRSRRAAVRGLGPPRAQCSRSSRRGANSIGSARISRASTPKPTRTGAPTFQSYDQQQAGGPISIVFLSLMGAVGFVLIIACANVANLLLARSVNRVREIAIRVSLGAGRWRIVRQLLVESVLLACLSGAAGFAMAIAGVRWFDRATQGVGKPACMTFTFDPIVFVFVAAICLLDRHSLRAARRRCACSKPNVNDVLKENGRGGTGGAGARHWTGALVILEVVLTLVLLSGAGYMMRSFLSLLQMRTGFNATNPPGHGPLFAAHQVSGTRSTRRDLPAVRGSPRGHSRDPGERPHQ